MKKIIFLLVLSVLTMVSCASNEEAVNTDESYAVVVDSTGNEISFSKKPERTIVLGSSLAEIWLTAGGELIATTDDAINRIEMNEDVVSVGTHNEPNAEQILSLNPDLVIMTSKVGGQVDIEPVLSSAGVTVMFNDVSSFEDYLNTLKIYTSINQTEELYKTFGLDIEDSINYYIEQASTLEPKTGLFLRTSSAYLKALPSDNFAVKIMEDMGIENIASSDNQILEDLSIESIIKEDPYYIFLVIMGSDEQAGMDMFNSYVESNPAWNTLTAVQEGRFIIVPKDLFHYKPNARWGEAYEYIYNIREEQE